MAVKLQTSPLPTNTNVSTVMKQMIKQVQASVDLAKADALKQQLTDSEIQHVDTCIQIIDESVEELSAEVELITAMSDLI